MSKFFTILMFLIFLAGAGIALYGVAKMNFGFELPFLASKEATAPKVDDTEVKEDDVPAPAPATTPKGAPPRPTPVEPMEVNPFTGFKTPADTNATSRKSMTEGSQMLGQIAAPGTRTREHA